jgi:adenylate kinase
MKMKNIILCGPPGCGKGTQSKLIEDNYKFKHLSTGDLLRSEIASNSELGLIAEDYISKGNFVPDDMIIDILEKNIDKMPENSEGIILDGFPRTVNQAEVLEDMLKNRKMDIDLLIDINVDEEELMDRLMTRGLTSGRTDDNLDTIKKRLEVYHEKTKPVNNFYKNLNKYASIDGMGSVNDIFKRISTLIDDIKQ